MRRERYLYILLVLVLPGPRVFAGHWLHGESKTPPPGPPRVFEHSQARAGWPQCVSPHATPTNCPGYMGYYVGGGSACHGCARRPEEGTFGWDYGGVHFPRHIRLAWSHGRREQEGTGSYKTDGPPLHVDCGHHGHGQ